MSSPERSTPSDNRGPSINASIWVLEALAGIFLGLRISCKCLRRRGLWWDDYLLIASWIFLLASAVSTTHTVGLGFGSHFLLVPPGNVETLGILSLVSGATSILSSQLSKTSFATTLLRLSDGWMRILIWTIIISMNILMPISALFLWVSCNPPEKIWKPYLDGTCWDPQAQVVYGIVAGAYVAACDFLLALLPWKILLRFSMYRREKTGVAVAMSMGIFAGATAIAKCVTLPLLGSPDFTYDGAPFVIWGFAECAVTIMAASIPALRALLSEVSGPVGLRVPSLMISPWTKPGDSNNTAPAVRGDGQGLDDRSDKTILSHSSALFSPLSPESPAQAHTRG